MRRVSSSSHGRAMGGERSVRVGACPGRREVRRLERIRVGTDVPGARERGGGRFIEPDSVLEELKGGRIRDAALVIRLLFGAKNIGAEAHKLGRAIVLLLLFNTTRAHTPLVLLLFNTTRMVPGPPSTGVAIAMDGGMADTVCYYTGR